MSKTVLLTLPIKPQAKARPRVTGNGTYMPQAYQKWRREFVAACQGQEPGKVDGVFALSVRFVTKSGAMRPDLDNAAGAVLDALQDAGVIENDRNCRRLVAEVVKGKRAQIEIQLEAA